MLFWLKFSDTCLVTFFSSLEPTLRPRLVEVIHASGHCVVVAPEVFSYVRCTLVPDWGRYGLRQSGRVSQIRHTVGFAVGFMMVHLACVPAGSVSHLAHDVGFICRNQRQKHQGAQGGGSGAMQPIEDVCRSSHQISRVLVASAQVLFTSGVLRLGDACGTWR